MFANRALHQIRPGVAAQQAPLHCTPDFPLPGEAEFPAPPALPDALLQLELSLSAFVVDLGGVTDIIRGDIGLTVQLLRLAARVPELSLGKISAISEIACQVGVDRLKALVCQTNPLPIHFRDRAGLSACERFWTHSRLAALIAEELSEPSSEVTPQAAYLAGLLYRAGEIPSVLGRAPVSAVDALCNGYRMAKAWELPQALADVMSGYRELCCTRESRALFDIATAADTWATRLEFLAVRAIQSEASAG